jgi:hypothetical protein
MNEILNLIESAIANLGRAQIVIDPDPPGYYRVDADELLKKAIAQAKEARVEYKKLGRQSPS